MRSLKTVTTSCYELPKCVSIAMSLSYPGPFFNLADVFLDNITSTKKKIKIMFSYQLNKIISLSVIDNLFFKILFVYYVYSVCRLPWSSF